MNTSLTDLDKDWVGGTRIIIFLMANGPCGVGGGYASVLHWLGGGWGFESEHGRRGRSNDPGVKGSVRSGHRSFRIHPGTYTVKL